MRDQSVEEAGAAPAADTAATGTGRIGPRGALRVVLAVALGVLFYFARAEGGPASIAFVSLVTLAIAAAVLLATRRLMFSAVAVAALVGVVVTASSIKRQAMDMVLHAYDIVFYAGSWSTLSYLWSDHRASVLSMLAAIALALVALIAAYRLDGTRVARRSAAMALVVLASAGLAASFVKGERRHTQFYWEDLFVSSFYVSWRETIETLWRGQLIEAAEASRGPALAAAAACSLPSKPPHIILIHQESIVQPELFPALDYDRTLDAHFKSFDGLTRRMRVETYGGASWLTEFSILAGVSTYSFGGMRPFVQSLMQGRVRDTLPQALQRCGYRNVVFYPMLRNFVSNDKFYKAIALEEVFDLKDQGARTVNERDRFYYANALDEIGRHVGRSGRPLFTFIQTMAAHSPYTFAYRPEEKVAGGGPGTDPEMHEYLRRLAMARDDYTYLESELARRFPGERFVIVHYGDHQPVATRKLLGQEAGSEAEDVALAEDSLGFVTYYAVRGINYVPPAPPRLEMLDVPYLGLAVMEAARLPLSDSFAERARLREICGGRYHGCAKSDEILAFHRRLIDSGLIDVR
jgi:phosphoglycerol transferase MdoB-like AlkP superfamily enzyme